MAKTKDAPPTTEEQERAQHEPAAAEPEVRSEEFGEGVGVTVGADAWPTNVIEALEAPLDPNRIRRRQGRGTGQLEYLAGHDVKRQATRIFGFGNWGHQIVSLEEIAAVEVENRDGKEGWHVGYRCTVRVWVERLADAAYITEGVGYGDGVEYTGAARVTACELAMKEAETDALKRAFTDLGDQFGLILYAKADERKRIDRDRDAADTTGPVVRREGGEQPTPHSWAEVLSRFSKLFAPEPDEYATATAKEWLRQALHERYGLDSIAELRKDRGREKEAFQLAASVLLALEEHGGDFWFGKGVRDTVARAFSVKWQGIALTGPPWRLGPDEPTMPTYDEWAAENAPEATPGAGEPAAPAGPAEAVSGPENAS